MTAVSAADRYVAPVDAIVRAMEVVGLDRQSEFPAYAHADASTVRTLLEEFGRFTADVIGPTDRVGDREGARLDPATGAVSTPAAFGPAYRRYVDAGWGAVAFPADHGGGGMPPVVGVALQEMLASANLALSLNPVLTQSAIELLARWGDESQRERYLPKLLTGEWTGAMVLTEPDAGSDLGALRARAERADDGTWRVRGSKIFITWGEHDLAANIVHLVLARTPGAPPGTKGISLFVVPKVLPDGSTNRIRCVGLEHKLGIHASPTCQLEYDDAVGELVGDECGGMVAMFTMMNAARLSIGVQGLAVGERSYQQAVAFARERRQGRAPGTPAGVASPIVEHPDVRRMLLDLRSSTRAMRLLLYRLAAAVGEAREGPDEGDERERAARAADLLTPIAKAWCTDTGFRLASVALQVHGGMGYVEETGIAQRLRDVRIASIYEGTNGIQAIDLVTRKLARDDGRGMDELLAEVGATVGKLSKRDGALGEVGRALRVAVAALRSATAWLVARLPNEPEDALAGATPFLSLAALVTAGSLLARQALAADRLDPASEAVADASFFAVEWLSSCPGLVVPVTAGASRLRLGDEDVRLTQAS